MITPGRGPGGLLGQRLPFLGWAAQGNRYNTPAIPAGLPPHPFQGLGRRLKKMALPIASMVSEPIGMAVDAYDLIGGLLGGDTSRAGFAAAGLAMPIGGGRLLKGAKAAGEVAEEAPKGIRAYHGSPHDFDKFNASQIGAGEGSQAFGHGLYFAESEGVANQYRRALSETDPTANHYLKMWQGDRAKALQAFDDDVAAGVFGAADTGSTRAMLANAPGHTYEVNVNAEPDDFLDWDAPLSEQPPKVREALRASAPRKALADMSDGEIENVLQYTDPNGDWIGSGLSRDDLLGAAEDMEIEDYLAAPLADTDRGETIYKQLTAQHGGGAAWSNEAQAKAAAQLRQRGVAGIRYLDQGSRGAKEGTRNMVVFDDSLVEILRKYGLAGVGIGTAGGALSRHLQERSR